MKQKIEGGTDTEKEIVTTLLCDCGEKIQWSQNMEIIGDYKIICNKCKLTLIEVRKNAVNYFFNKL